MKPVCNHCDRFLERYLDSEVMVLEGLGQVSDDADFEELVEGEEPTNSFLEVFFNCVLEDIWRLQGGNNIFHLVNNPQNIKAVKLDSLASQFHFEAIGAAQWQSSLLTASGVLWLTVIPCIVAESSSNPAQKSWRINIDLFNR